MQVLQNSLKRLNWTPLLLEMASTAETFGGKQVVFKYHFTPLFFFSRLLEILWWYWHWCNINECEQLRTFFYSISRFRIWCLAYSACHLLLSVQYWGILCLAKSCANSCHIYRVSNVITIFLFYSIIIKFLHYNFQWLSKITLFYC